MAYAKARSANDALHQGVNEGGDNYPGKDWGGVMGSLLMPEHVCTSKCEHPSLDVR